MTVTEAPPSAPAEASLEAQRELSGLPALLGTGDHKTVGRLWIGTSALLLLLVVVVGALLGFERLDLASNEVLGSDHVLQFFSLYRFGLVFLVVLPLFLGLATTIVPLQVGAPSLAFPRGAAAAFWLWFGGVVLLLVGYGINGGPVGTGDADAVALSLLGLGFVVIGLLLATICVLTTAIALRTPHLRLSQVPPFTWSMLVAGVIWLLSYPVLLTGLLLAYLDLRYGQLLFGQKAELFQRLEWVFAQPQVYAMAIPVLGIAAEIVPVCSKVVQRHRGVLWGGIAAFGAFTFGAWAQPYWLEDVYTDGTFVAVSFAVLIPLVVVLGGLADTARRNRPRFNAAGPLALLAVLCLLGAAAGGAAAAVEDLELLGTSWQSGLLDLVFGASLLGAAAGLSWWAPKIWGRHLLPAFSLLGGLFIVGGAILASVGQGLAGAYDVTNFPYADPRQADLDGAADLGNVLAVVGAVVLAIGAIALVLGLVKTITGRTVAEDADDPWEGQTLEWRTTSPPPWGNFAEPLPVVTSPTPLLDAEEDA